MKEFEHKGNLIVKYGRGNYSVFIMLDEENQDDIFEVRFTSLNAAKKWLDKQ